MPLSVYYPKAHMKHGTTATNGVVEILAPPAADSRFIVLEDGNASPHMLRCTMAAMPMDRQVLRQTSGGEDGKNSYGILGLLCSPLAIPSLDHVHSTTTTTTTLNYDNHDNGDNNKMPLLPPSGMMGCVILEGSGTVVRCTRCNAYANAFWEAGTCNFCGQTRNIGSVSSGTMEYKDLTGPFLTRESGPVKPVVVYCIDLMAMSTTTSSLAWDALQLIRTDVIPAYAKHFQTQQDASPRRLVAPRVGIVFSMGREGVYMIDKRTKSLVVMPDTEEDPYCPLPLTEFSWNLAEELQDLENCFQAELAESVLPALLERAKNMTQQSQGSNSSGGAAMRVLVDGLKETGGRAVYISSRRPDYGVGAIPDREAKVGVSKAYSSPVVESWLYTPLQDALPRALADATDKAASIYYSKLGEECVKYKVAMDIVILGGNNNEKTSFLHAATLSKLCQVSNGRFVWIQQRGTDWKTQFRQELIRPLVNFAGWDAVLKVRCSSGLRVKSITSGVGIVTQASNSLTDVSPEVELVTVTPDTCVAVTLDHRVGGLPKQAKFGYVQTALLYTNPWTGQRRLRVSTLALRTAASPAVAFRSIDFGCVASLLMRRAVAKMTPEAETAHEKPAVEDSMRVVMETVLNVLAAYRKYGSNQALGPSQFVLPDKLKLLPLFCMGLRKSPMFRKSLRVHRGGMTSSPMPSPTADERAYALYHASRCSPATAMYLLHPILLDMTATTTQEGGVLCDWVESRVTAGSTMDMLQNSPFIRLPEALQASISNMADDKVYLLDTMMTFYILIGKDVPQDTMQSIQQAMASPSFEEDHPIGRAIHQLRLFSQVGREPRWLRPYHAPVVLVHHDDPVFQSSILKWMVCDATDQDREYSDFLIHLHTNVGTRMSSV
jgi:hypothetical protein